MPSDGFLVDKDQFLWIDDHYGLRRSGHAWGTVARNARGAVLAHADDWFAATPPVVTECLRETWALLGEMTIAEDRGDAAEAENVGRRVVRVVERAGFVNLGEMAAEQFVQIARDAQGHPAIVRERWPITLKEAA